MSDTKIFCLSEGTVTELESRPGNSGDTIRNYLLKRSSVEYGVPRVLGLQGEEG
jgi:hypothetical protein